MSKERKTFEITITKMIEVEYDTEKFTDEVINDFNDHIYYVGDKIEEHVKNIVEMHAKDLDYSGFLEGYGPLEDLGVKFNDLSEDVESELVR